eukprot:15550-Heterococcus_DN1.PRE.4
MTVSRARITQSGDLSAAKIQETEANRISQHAEMLISCNTMLGLVTLLLCSFSIAHADDQKRTVATAANAHQLAARVGRKPFVDPCTRVGLRSCLGTCTNTLTDPLNCGGCGKTCPRSATSQGGVDVCVQGDLEFITLIVLLANCVIMAKLA